MSEEIIPLLLRRYKGKEEQPTCCEHYPDKVCIFYRETHLGTRESCAYLEKELAREVITVTQTLDGVAKEYHRAMGFLIPHEKCPLWKDRS